MWVGKGGGSKGGALKGGGSKGGGFGGGPNPEKVGPQRVGGRRVGGPKFRAFFSLSRRKICSFLPSLGVFLVEFWWGLKCRGAQMCWFGVLLADSSVCQIHFLNFPFNSVDGSQGIQTSLQFTS